MVAPASTSVSSLKDYLKKYESGGGGDKDSGKRKKKKNKRDVEAIGTESKKIKPKKSDYGGIRVVDEDPVWAKPVNDDEEDEVEEEAGEPQVEEDIEVKRMKRLEQLRARRAYGALSEDGSGWVSVSDHESTRNFNGNSVDLSPPRRRERNSISSTMDYQSRGCIEESKNSDMSPPRRRASSSSRIDNDDLSPPRRRSSSTLQKVDVESSPPRKRSSSNSYQGNADLSPPRKQGSSISNRKQGDVDLSPPRKHGASSSRLEEDDLSPPRKRAGSIASRNDLSPPRKRSLSSRHNVDLSPPRKAVHEKDARIKKHGLLSKQDMGEEISKNKQEETLRFAQMDPSLTGHGAEPVYRIKGKIVSKDEFMKARSGRSQETKPQEVKLEWGQGLAQKKEAEAQRQELEQEKDKPFARQRDDPDLDKMLKNRIRWGDPMAHLLKRKDPELELEDLGNDERMKESGFLIPQDVPSHSWLKRGVDPPENRYGIKPGRHWDGVDRSNGFEKDLFKRRNNKRATESEAYLWSVADM